MTTTIDRAIARADACARRMLRDGYEPYLIYESLITTGLAMWAAETGNATSADSLLRTWAAARDSAPEAE